MRVLALVAAFTLHAETAAEYQPVHIATDLAVKIPLFLRAVFGTNVRQTGSAVTYFRRAAAESTVAFGPEK